ncbi:MAG TPA: hypothetical protein PL160_02055 [Candidatus Cloacimonas sp.]|jgi:hypothetical protein|nr:hypothetical protein [Candidatus Cloacimonas sp.]
MNSKEKLHLGKLNVLLLILAAVLLILGYFIMSFNEISVSPVLLALVYVVIIPLALLYHPKKD